MENNKNKKSVKFQGDMLNFYDFIQVFVFTTNHHLKAVGICHLRTLLLIFVLVLIHVIEHCVYFSLLYPLYNMVNKCKL